jgi:TRAP-type C4-dicarboxylate transport system, periplasmic component
MKKRSTIALIALFAMLFTLVTISGIAAAPKKIVMKISHVSAPGSARDIGSHKVKEVVEKMTNGLVTAQVYPSSQLGGQRDQVEGVQFGTIEMVVVPTSYLGGIQPLITLLDTPFLLPENPQTLY